LRFVLQQHSLTVAQRKITMLVFRRHLLKKIAQDLPEALRLRKLTDSEVLTCVCAARQTARKALREHAAGRLDDAGLNLVQTEVDSVLSLVTPEVGKPKPYRGDTFPSRVAWAPFGHFKEFIDAFNMGEPARAALAGPPMIVEPPPFVDLGMTQELFQTDANGSSISRYEKALQGVVSCVEEFEKQKSVHAKRQVLALVEDLLVGCGSAILLKGKTSPRGRLTATKCRHCSNVNRGSLLRHHRGVELIKGN
jgi:hypothetical protein